ncbi:membrane transporter [Oryctes borbonicus]|uniref:Membrane transporter n=1 Tax=Oryctes borbonicus TaxID=1629725 RepID=A0A0T6B2U7_9SCAR|nr:membrane transporter [Oryctes borbonicus]
MNSSAAISMFCGIFNGPLLRHFGYRKVALVSACLTTFGVLLTARANSFLQYILTYGLITSYGMGMSISAYSIAVSSYFKEKRAKAMGYAMTISGIGPIIMPQIFSYLLWSYGATGTLTIVAGIATHTFFSGLLLQPVKWHMKEKVVEDCEEDKLLHEEPYYGSTSSRRRRHSEGVSEDKGNLLPKPTLPSEEIRTDNINEDLNGKLNGIYPDEDDKKPIIEEQKESLLKRIGKYLVDLFDLTLLKDPVYVNIMIGMSFAIFAEMNFSLLTPFIMQDYGLETQEIATFMSTVSIADICFRFIAPYVSEFFKQSSRPMFLWALVLLILSRSSLLCFEAYYALLACAFFLGIAKGFRTVYWSLVIPDYVPIERLAAAAGMQSTFNSIFMWVGGSFLGFIRDVLGSFKYCIIVINAVTFITIVMWIPELAYRKWRLRRENAVTRDVEDVK